MNRFLQNGILVYPLGRAEDTGRFPLGDMLATAAGLWMLERTQTSALALLSRHQSGDWGTIGVGDARMNEDALEFGGPLLSAYDLSDGTVVWIMTDADRDRTTIFLPEEY